MVLKVLGSEPGFLRIRVTAADLSDDGTEPEVREEWVLLALRRRSWRVNQGAEWVNDRVGVFSGASEFNRVWSLLL